jgi:hypothetical protein
MNDKPTMTRQQAIDELRREARELEEKPCSFREYARNAYRARIRRQLADKLEQELGDRQDDQS